jgi:hypothetical protein
MIRFLRRLWRRISPWSGWRGSPYGRGLFESATVSSFHHFLSPFQDPHTCDLAYDDGECSACSVRDCPGHEPLHYHHDGCPQCSFLSAADD